MGKTTIGAKLANLLNCPFIELDEEIERFFGTSIERLQDRFLTVYSFTIEAAKALEHCLQSSESNNCVIELPPGGLMKGYWRVVKKSTGIRIVLSGRPEDILGRITFYDIDSKLIDKQLTSEEKQFYLNDIKKDVTYYRKSYERADFTVSISGLNTDEASQVVKKKLLAFIENNFDTKGEKNEGKYTSHKYLTDWDRIVPEGQTPGEPVELSLEDADYQEELKQFREANTE